MLRRTDGEQLVEELISGSESSAKLVKHLDELATSEDESFARVLMGRIGDGITMGNIDNLDKIGDNLGKYMDFNDNFMVFSKNKMKNIPDDELQSIEKSLDMLASMGEKNLSLTKVLPRTYTKVINTPFIGDKIFNSTEMHYFKKMVESIPDTPRFAKMRKRFITLSENTSKRVVELRLRARNAGQYSL